MPAMSPGAPCSTSATCRRRSTPSCSRTTPIACRRANCSSPIRFPAGTTKCAMDAEHLADSIAALGLEAGLAKYQREQGAFGSGIVRQGQRDGSYITDQLKPREQRRNKDLSWAVDDLMRDHDGRSVQVQRIFEESRRSIR